jgi:hypothetical protein
MGDASTLLTVGTAFIQGMQGRQQAKAQRLEGQYLEDVANSNARIMDMQAQDALERGEKKAQDVKTQTKKLIGSQRARMAAQGLDLEEDDALAIQQESAEMGAMDAREIKNNAWQEAWGFRVQAQDYRNKGVFANISGKQKARSTVLTTGLNIMNTFASSGKSTPRYQMQS